MFLYNKHIDLKLESELASLRADDDKDTLNLSKIKGSNSNFSGEVSSESNDDSTC